MSNEQNIMPNVPNVIFTLAASLEVSVLLRLIETSVVGQRPSGGCGVPLLLTPLSHAFPRIIIILSSVLILHSSLLWIRPFVLLFRFLLTKANILIGIFVSSVRSSSVYHGLLHTQQATFSNFSNSSDSKGKVKVKGPNMCYIFEKHGIQGYQI